MNKDLGPTMKVKSTAKADESPAKGEVWAVLRAVLLLIGGILVLGYLIT